MLACRGMAKIFRCCLNGHRLDCGSRTPTTVSYTCNACNDHARREFGSPIDAYLVAECHPKAIFNISILTILVDQSSQLMIRHARWSIDRVIRYRCIISR